MRTVEVVVYESNRLRSAVKGRGNDQQTWSLRKEVSGADQTLPMVAMLYSHVISSRIFQLGNDIREHVYSEQHVKRVSRKRENSGDCIVRGCSFNRYPYPSTTPSRHLLHLHRLANQHQVHWEKKD